MKRRDIAVVGGGLTGYATAIALAIEGFDTILVAPPTEAEDRRSTALIGGSVGFLADIGLFGAIRDGGEELTVMRIVDDTGRLFRAPTVEFRASEIGLSGFGYNMLNHDLLHALRARAATLPHHLEVVETSVLDLDVENDAVRLVLSDGAILRVALAIGADGRKSVVRDRSGIRFRDWSYPQTAIVLNFTHRFDHGQTSTEFHTPTGPFTQVPLPGRMSSLVWVEKPDAAALLADVDRDRLAEIIETKMHSILGAVEVDGLVQSFPLKGATATRMTGSRIALVGESAHVFPPIGAQGLNLGLRDAAAVVAAAVSARDDPGSAAALGRYEAGRRADVASRTVGVDLLNRSLLATFLPTQALRATGLSAMASIPVLRRFAMREGVSPGAGLGGLP